MELFVLQKVVLFWIIFYLSPGPVWVSVMEATRTQSWRNASLFLLRVFLPSCLVMQVFQAVICIVFVDFVSRLFAHIGLVLYIAGGLYIAFLAYKVLTSKRKNTLFVLTFLNVCTIMFVSPKVWLLFPAGAATANMFSESLVLNAAMYAATMLLISNSFFFLYVAIGKVGTKILNEKFAYISFGLLALFALFLFAEALSLVTALL